MKRIVQMLLVVASAVAAMRWAGAATVVSGNVSVTWTANQSPYILNADCTVVSNQTLTIQPGVEVVILPDVNLRVNGGIVAIGTIEQWVTIRGAGPTNYWASIQMTYSGFTNKFRYCQISEGTDALWFVVDGGNHTMIAEITECEFRNCRERAVFGQTSGYQVTGPVGSPVGSATLAPEIHNCVFDNSLVQNGDGFACYFTVVYNAYNTSLPPGDAFANPHITGNLFRNLPKRLTFPNQVGTALRLEASYPRIPSTNVSRPVFVNNTVVRSYAGVEDGGPSFEVEVHNNIFSDLITGVYRYASSSPPLHTGYNCFYRNSQNFAGYPGSYGVPIINNHNGDPCDGFFNIFLDPRFLDTNTFLLSNFSPCIDAGDPAIADVCFQFSHGSALSDIGAYGGPDACGWLTHGFAPVITGAPADQSSCVGGSATFKVRVEGSAPLGYRWYFNRTNLLAGETNAQLNLVNLQTNLAGLYSAAVSNAFGSVTSAPARLLVFDACVGINLYAGLSITGMVGRTYALESATNLGATNWTLVATNTFTTPRWLFIDTNTPFNSGNFFRVRLLP